MAVQAGFDFVQRDGSSLKVCVKNQEAVSSTITIYPGGNFHQVITNSKLLFNMKCRHRRIILRNRPFNFKGVGGGGWAMVFLLFFLRKNFCLEMKNIFCLCLKKHFFVKKNNAATSFIAEIVYFDSEKT